MKRLERTKPDEEVAEHVVGGVHAEYLDDRREEGGGTSHGNANRGAETTRRRTDR